MDDKKIYITLRTALMEGFKAFNLSNVSIVRAYQPTSQGREDGMAVYMTKILDKRFGHPERKETYRADTDDFLHTETVWYESTFQIIAMVEENPKETEGLTAVDLINRAAHILQSDAGIALLRQNGLMPLRVTDIRNPYFQNDKGQFEASPSFDIILTHKQVVTSVIPAAQTVQGKFDHGYKY